MTLLQRSALVAAMGGFLFGFDTAVISGAEQQIQQLWRLDALTHGLALAMALYGTVLGSLIGGIPSDRLGRKPTLTGIAILYLVSAVGSALAPEVYSFMFFRFIGGVGVGISSVVAPMYISEISPAQSRGRLVAAFQFNIVLGILIAYLSNYLISGMGRNDWRLMLGVEAIPAALFAWLLRGVPESPRWLILKQNRADEALAVFQRLQAPDPHAEVDSIRASAIRSEGLEKTPLFRKPYWFPVWLAFLFAFFNQFSGINAIIYFAPRIFGMTGMEASSALLSTTGIGAVNLLFTLVGMTLIDRYGRRTLMLIGSVGLIVALLGCAVSFFTQSFAPVPWLIFMFIGFFAMSQGAVIWVFISEIFPNVVRAKGQSLGSFTHWIFAALITNLFPLAAERIGGGPIFLFFAVMMLLQLAYVFWMMPETKGRSLEELEQGLARRGASGKITD